MPWCEYLIMCYGYKRKNLDEWKQTRFLAWHTLIASPNQFKNLPSLEKFVNAGERKERNISDSLREEFMKQSAEYYKNLKKNK